MNNYFGKVRNYLQELDLVIVRENEDDGVLVVEKESNGIKNLVIGCAEPILIMEQFLVQLPYESLEVYKCLLKKNRDIIHGAFVLDDSSRKVIFRDTLQLDTLDKNELEATLNSLSLLLTEFSNELIRFSKI